MRNPIYKTIENLLKDKLFIQWIINPTPELDKLWQQHMQNNKQLQQIIEDLKDIIKNIRVKEPEVSAEDKKLIWSNIKRELQIQQSKKKRKQAFTISLVSAATIIALLFGGYWLWDSKLSNNNEINYTTYITDDEEIMKSGNINLTLSNNKQIDIEKDSTVITYNAKGQVNIDSKEIHEEETAADNDAPILNQLIVPYGKSTSLILSDGTKIWVNSGSKIIYPSVFDKKKREIFLTGEAYMDVKPDKNAPFIIKTDHIDVNVLGTKLNISAYKEDEIQSVVLVSGAVEVKSKELKGSFKIEPEQMLAYGTVSKDINIQKVNTDHYTSWIEGYLLIRSESLDTVLQKLSRHFNVKFDYNREEFKKIYVSGKLDLKANIEEVLKLISITTPISYSIGENQITIKIK